MKTPNELPGISMLEGVIYLLEGMDRDNGYEKSENGRCSLLALIPARKIEQQIHIMVLPKHRRCPIAAHLQHTFIIC